MKPAQRQVRGLFTRLEQRTARTAPDHLMTLRSFDGFALRLRELRLGERIVTGDLWHDGNSFHLVVIPWWRRWDRTLTENHHRHYRVSA